MSKIVIAGGTGFLGECLVNFYKNKRKDIVILSRRPVNIENARVFQWDAENQGAWSNELEGVEAVINLCGKSVDCRYTEKNKALIYSSRINPTLAIGRAIENCKNPPKVWINSSSATVYRHSPDKPMDEETGEIGEGFSVDVCQKWEEAFNSFRLPNTRRVIARIAIVLGKKGGALQPLTNLVRLGMGGHQGPGNQMMSWLHEDDFTGMIDYLVNNPLSGIVNLASPKPVNNKQFMKSIRIAVGVTMGLPTPAWLLEIGARIIKTETELVLKSRYVVPKRFLNAGYSFQFTDVDTALKDLVV